MKAIEAAKIVLVVAKQFSIDDVPEAYREQSKGPVGKLSIRLDW
ncbi:hypothetical protein [Rhizobium lentis]|uniref:Alcohol dehydrogenase n=1 Tax=Rhizobium lentis TaxID=1138194 RepID=A0A7W8UN36_9HYPH|nr:hypothetical protein [Rhizobium lentis]MBB4574937.1 hypothetical protein [Rhizobium lentis]MBB5550864.1 hypothetical protein [Rhizobium lentis]MBB5561014.1 hypothetical protein [Rhizobium lentis]MBB5567983.1 hypothetical protein [Rhizobium lentis]